jgi:hypothetical protein
VKLDGGGGPPEKLALIEIGLVPTTTMHVVPAALVQPDQETLLPGPGFAVSWIVWFGGTVFGQLVGPGPQLIPFGPNT